MQNFRNHSNVLNSSASASARCIYSAKRSYQMHLSGKGSALTPIRLITGANIHKFKPDNNSQNLLKLYRGDGAVGWSVRLGSGRLGVRIPAATDLSRKNR